MLKQELKMRFLCGYLAFCIENHHIIRLKDNLLLKLNNKYKQAGNKIYN